MTEEPSVLVAGETLVDFVPENAGPPGAAGGYRPQFGGAPANVALAMARLAPPPLLWTRLAADDFGAFLRGHLDDAGIPDDLVVRDPDARTTVAVVTHDEDGDRSFTFYRENGADTRLERGTVPDATLAAVDWVHTSGVPLSVAPARGATLDLQARASERVTVSLDPNWRPELWDGADEYRTVVRGALDRVDVLTASVEDLAAAGFAGEDPAAMARAATDRGPHTVVVTLGGDGALCYGTDESPFPGLTAHEGYEVDVVDATGAGDVFVAAFVAAVTSGVTDGERALALANAAGAAAVTQAGAVTAIEGPAALRRFSDALPWRE